MIDRRGKIVLDRIQVRRVYTSTMFSRKISNRFNNGFLAHLFSPHPADRGAGFATLPNQVHAESLEAGFCLNVLVMGGRFLLCALICRGEWAWQVNPHQRHVYDRYLCGCRIRTSGYIFYFIHFSLRSLGARPQQTLKINKSTVYVEEQGVRLRLSLIDTPGFGNSIDNSDRYCSV